MSSRDDAFGSEPRANTFNHGHQTDSDTESDQPFRNLYGSSLLSEQEDIGAQSHLPRVTESQSLRRESDSEEEIPKLTKALEIPRTPPSESDGVSQEIFSLIVPQIVASR